MRTLSASKSMLRLVVSRVERSGSVAAGRAAAGPEAGRFAGAAVAIRASAPPARWSVQTATN